VYKRQGNIFAGYGRTLNKSYYLGGEIFGNCFSSTLKKSNGSLYHQTVLPPEILLGISNISSTVKNRYSFGGDIRAGYLVSPRTMIYVLFGLDYARFNVKSGFGYSGSLVENPPTPPIYLFSGQINDEFNKWKLGYMPGIGIETGLTDHVSLRAEYTHTFYSSFSHTVNYTCHTTSEYVVDCHATLKTKVKPSRGLFTVKLSYLFS